MNRITATFLCLMLCLAGTSLHATAFAAEQTSVSAPSAPSPATPAQVVALKTPLTRPFAAPVTTRTVIVPDTIDATGTDDVSDALMAFINGVADGTLINFPSAAVYRIDKAIEFEGRHNLIFDGNGCTLKYTSITGTLEKYSLWRDLGTGSDIWIKNFVLIGSSPHPGVYTPGTSPTGGEWQHGVIMQSDRFEVSGCTVSAVWGDGFYVSGGATDVWIHDNHVISNGRQGLAVISATNVIAERNAFDKVGLAALDVEPNGAAESCVNIIFRNNTIGTYGTPALFDPNVFTVYDFPEVVIDGIVIDNNIVTGGSFCTNIDSSGAVRMTRISFTNNVGQVADTGPVLQFMHVDGLTITGNLQPLSSGTLAYITDCTGAP